MPPLYTPDEANSRETFLALMWSLSYPGIPHALLPGEPFAAIGAALLDIETTYTSTDADLSIRLSGLGARQAPPHEAAYHFYPALDDDALSAIARASVGTMLYPDTAATLIVGAAHSGGPALALTGPGIATINPVALAVPEAFWALRARVARFPLGWDVFFVDADAGQVIGLPRSTAIERA